MSIAKVIYSTENVFVPVRLGDVPLGVRFRLNISDERRLERLDIAIPKWAGECSHSSYVDNNGELNVIHYDTQVWVARNNDGLPLSSLSCGDTFICDERSYLVISWNTRNIHALDLLTRKIRDFNPDTLIEYDGSVVAE